MLINVSCNVYLHMNNSEEYDSALQNIMSFHKLREVQMEKNITTYRKWKLFNDIIEMSVPTDFDEYSLTDDRVQPKLPEETALWTNVNRDTVAIFRVQENSRDIQDIIQIMKGQLVTEKSTLKNVGFYSRTRNDIEQVMSEDELYCGDDALYIMSSVYRYKNLCYMIYQQGLLDRKVLIRERMIYMLDSIHFNEESVNENIG